MYSSLLDILICDVFMFMWKCIYLMLLMLEIFKKLKKMNIFVFFIFSTFFDIFPDIANIFFSGPLTIFSLTRCW
jgi:hypothetical protein